MAESDIHQVADRHRKVAALLRESASDLDFWLTAENLEKLADARDTPEVMAYVAALADIRDACESNVAVISRIQQVTRMEGANDV